MDPKELCKEYGLRYGQAGDLQILRKGHGKGFRYWLEGGEEIRDELKKKRFKALTIPPVYKNVRISIYDQAHLQAVGHDTTDTKQYFYHPKWEDIREQTKFLRLCKVGASLPAIRRKLRTYLNEPEHSKYHVLAGVIRLLDETGLRIGNEESAKEARTYGLSTLEKQHLSEDQAHHFHLNFQGKGGVEIERTLRTHFAEDFLEEALDTPGRHLFRYEDDQGFHDVTPVQINTFLRHLSDLDMSAKDFRTWRSSALFVKAYLTSRETKPTLKSLLEYVAQYTGNTPAILRTSYIHPVLIDHAKNHTMKQAAEDAPPFRGLRQDEEACLHILTQATGA